MNDAPYQPSQTGPRWRRPSPAQMVERKAGLFDIVAELQPATVRQVFYQATVRGLVEKTEKGYDKVQRGLASMRRDNELPFEWITDSTRSGVKPRSYTSPAEAVRQMVGSYRLDLWDDADCYVEVWCEKDALTGVLYPVTAELDARLMVARGYPSITFLYSAAEVLADQERPCFVYHLGDFDPSGQDAAAATEADLRGFAPNADITFTRLAVTPRQIADWSLPTRPTKKSDSRTASWTGGDSVELDAIDPQRLRALVRRAIMRHLPESRLRELKAVEAEHRAELQAWADGKATP